MLQHAKESVAHFVKEQEHQFGLDKEGAKEAANAAKDYAEGRRKDRVKKGKEADIQDMQWDTVKFVDRYGEEHYVSSAMAEDMQNAEEEAMLDLEMDGRLPSPKLPRLAKDPDFGSVQLKINWTVPSDFGGGNSNCIQHAIVRWKKTENQHQDRNDLWSTDNATDLSSKGKVEYISTKTKGDQLMEGLDKKEKIIKNKRARFVEITGLLPDTEYQIFTSFVYTPEALKEHVEQGGVLNASNTTGEGEQIGPLVIQTADALLQCGNCGSTLNWGLEECVAKACRGSEISLNAWNK